MARPRKNDPNDPLQAVHVRLPRSVVQVLEAEADRQGVTLSDVIRTRFKSARVRPLGRRPKKTRHDYTSADPELIRQFAKIGNNLNQLARWCNTHKSEAEALDVLAALAGVEAGLKKIMEDSGAY